MKIAHLIAAILVMLTATHDAQESETKVDPSADPFSSDYYRHIQKDKGAIYKPEMPEDTLKTRFREGLLGDLTSQSPETYRFSFSPPSETLGPFVLQSPTINRAY